jgi:dihydropteroate synthase
MLKWSQYNVPYIMMHMRGTPTMQSMTDYKDIVKEIFLFFGEIQARSLV